MSKSHVTVYSSQQPLLRTTSYANKLLQFNHQLQIRHAMKTHSCFWPHEIENKQNKTKNLLLFVCLV